MEDLRQQLARVFAAELAEHVAALRTALGTADAGGALDLRDMFRRAHSLKGAARAADQPRIGEVADALESLLEQAETSGTLGEGARADARGMIDAIEDAAEPPEADAAPSEMPVAQSGDDLVRIPARNIDQLMGSLRRLQEDLDARATIASNLRTTRDRLEVIRQACSAPGATLAQISARLARLHVGMIETARHRIEADDRVTRAAAALERDGERILLVPAISAVAGLERMVRELADESGKRARLAIEDDGAEADRRVIQRLRDPLTQLLRNAVSHGIEAPAVRARAGKPADGAIRLDMRADRGSLSIRIEDDGAGPDARAIRAAAERRGLIRPGAVSADEAGLFALLFEHGVSTAGKADPLSGRGVGLAVVADAVRRLNGSVRLTRGSGGGTRIQLRVPLGVTRRPVLLVEAAGQIFALPSSAVSRLVRIGPSAMISVGGVPSCPVETRRGERAVPVVSLASVLGRTAGPAAGPVPALLIERDADAVLLVVDSLRDVRPLAFGDPADIAGDAPLVLGTATIDEGQVALVLSVDALLDRLARGTVGGAGDTLFLEPERRRTILVVDDSITTRTLERGILEGQGYIVLLAVDGLDGLERLRAADGRIDLIVADVEMPRLDGFGLLAAIRNDPVLARIPVVMMTSRASPDDIQRGLDLGADAYVTKQNFEQGELLATVRRLI